VSFNYTKNTNKITKLLADTVGNSLPVDENSADWLIGDTYIHHTVGLPASQIMAFEPQRNAQGQLMFDENGLPIVGALKPQGSGYHSVWGGFNNEFAYKNISLSFLIDFKSGGKIFSVTDLRAYQNGKHKETLAGREEGVTGEGVGPDGQPNTVNVPAQTYYENNANIHSQFVYDASFIKLRQVILSYSLPAKLFTRLPIKSVRLSLVGRNLAILKRYTDNIDPESNFNNSKAQGIDYGGVPPIRSYGFNLNIKF
jgi:hypothetical protein